MWRGQFGWAFLGVLLLTASACGEAADDAPCPEGTLRAGEFCIPEDSVGDPNPAPSPGVDPEPTPQPTPDPNPGPNPDPNPDPEPGPDVMPGALPFTVDDTYAASGYMGDGEQGAITDEEECASPRPGDGEGLCHKFTFTPGGQGWGGVFWQFPEGNWGDLPGYAMPQGATRVSFYAWGEQGGEVVKFLSGIGDADGFALETAETTLGTEPALYTILLGNTSYGEVVGPFGWVVGDVPGALSFFVDDIQWQRVEADIEEPPDGEGMALPFAVDSAYAASGYMGDGEQGAITDEEECASPRPGDGEGLCHKFTFTPGGQGWGGVFWQFPEGNWGDLPGLLIAPGASEVSFYAWGEQGGEVVKFLSGIGDADGFALETLEIPLTSEPVRYALDLSQVVYTDVAGGFGWVVGGVPGPVTFYLDDIRWE